MCASKSLGFASALLAALLLTVPVVEAAEKKPDPAREQARRLQQANRKLEQDKAQIAKEKTEAEGKLKEAEDRLGEVQRKVAGAQRRATDLAKDLDVLRGDKEKLAGQLAETEKRLTETGDKLRKEEGERKRLEALAAQQKQSIAQCEGLNAKLHDESVALLDRYRKKGCFDATLQGEPFTGLKQVEIENFIEDSRDKLDDLRLKGQIQQGSAGR
jgi:chromosome segregation ATPase